MNKVVGSFKRNANLIDGKYVVAEFHGGLKRRADFPTARAQYGDRITTNRETDRLLSDPRIWNAFKDKLNEAGMMYTRTIVAFSKEPLGDIERVEGGRIFISRTLSTKYEKKETVRFGGFSEADLKKAGIKLNEHGTLLVIDRKYEVRNEGGNSHSILIPPELMRHVDAFYNLDLRVYRGLKKWRKTDPKHMLPIGEKTGRSNPNARILCMTSKVGPVHRVSGDVHDDSLGAYGPNVYLGFWLGFPRGALVRAEPDLGELAVAAEK